MNFIFPNFLTNIQVIIFLEIILLVYSVALLIKADKWPFRIFSIILCIIWIICIILNILAA